MSHPVLAYQIIDKGLLHHLHGVTKTRDFRGNRTYFFDAVPEVGEVIQNFDANDYPRDISSQDFALW